MHNELANRTSWDDEYDFVVIGAGTAGSLVAARIAELDYKVLLLEAGGPVPVVSEVPALATEIGSKFQWGYETAPQKHVAQALINHKYPLERAKVFGGGSVENQMAYNRGKVQDFDAWNKNYGLRNWTYNKLLKFFKRSENLTDMRFLRRNPGIHAAGGPMAVSVHRNLVEPFDKFFKAIHKFGYPIIDLTELNGEGLSKITTSTRNGKRWSNEDGFLRHHKKNLHILAYARVTKLNIDINNRRRRLMVKSVEFYKNNKKYSVRAKCDFILSGGFIGSPHLLMLSGVGPKEHLEKLDIKVIADLPVGDNLQNHLVFTLIIDPIKPVQNIKTLENFYQFFVNGSGPLTSFYQMILNYKTKAEEDSTKNVPNFEVNMEWQNFSSNGYADQQAWSEYFGVCQHQHCPAFEAKINYPRSRGKLRLKSKDPFDQLIIDPNYASDPEDVEAMVLGLKKLFEIIYSPEFQKVATYRGPIPGCRPCGNKRFDCEEYLRCLIRQQPSVFHQLLGTCRVGKDSDRGAVVDEWFRVKTFDNLRVVDASVIPQLPGGHLNNVVQMIAELGVDTILRDQK